MKVVKNKDLPFVPASHENPQDPGVWKKVLLTKADIVEGRIQMVNWAKLPAGKSFSAHYHEDMQEIFILVTGTVEMQVDTETVTMEPGDLVEVPIKSVHVMKNTGEDDAQYIVFGVAIGTGGKTITLNE